MKVEVAKSTLKTQRKVPVAVTDLRGVIRGWRNLAGLGVDRVILLVEPPYPLDALRANGPS